MKYVTTTKADRERLNLCKRLLALQPHEIAKVTESENLSDEAKQFLGLVLMLKRKQH